MLYEYKRDTKEERCPYHHYYYHYYNHYDSIITTAPLSLLSSSSRTSSHAHLMALGLELAGVQESVGR
mgnify:FL=1